MHSIEIQKYQFLRFSPAKPNDDLYSAEVWEKDRIFLTLTAGENYSQYLDLGLNEGETVLAFGISRLGGEKLTAGTHFYSNVRTFGDRVVLLFGFKPTMKEGSCNTYFAVLTTNRRIIYSNYFNFSKDTTGTTLLTYWHEENFYNANYYDAEQIPQQMRIPAYFSHDFSEVDAEKFQDTYQNQNIYRTGKVKRLFMERWKVLLNDMNYKALSVALDSDHIYFNNQLVNVKPFEQESDEDEKGFTQSKIELQRFPDQLFDQGVFGDFFTVEADDISYNFDYDHIPLNQPNAGSWFLVNRLYINYRNDFGVQYDCGLKFRITKIPVKGFLAHNVTRKIYKVGDLESYCEKDELSYFPNGFDNDLWITGDFTETFQYKIVDQNGNTGREMVQTMVMHDVAPPPQYNSVISWSDGTFAPRSTQEATQDVLFVSDTNNPADPVISYEWQGNRGAGWIKVGEFISPFVFLLATGSNELRLKSTLQSGAVFYSNVLSVTRTAQTFPVQSYWFKARHPQGHSNVDKVVYKDKYGAVQETILQRSYTDPVTGVFHEAPCTEIVASQLVETFGAQSCTPGSTNCKLYKISIPPYTRVDYSFIDCGGVLREYYDDNTTGYWEEASFCAIAGSVDSTAGYVETGSCN